MLSEEVRKFIGQVVGTGSFKVEKEPIRRFADAVGDPNPLYRDEEYSQKSRYGSIIAPPGFISSPWFISRSYTEGRKEPNSETSSPASLIPALAQAGYTRAIDSGIEYEFFQPVRVGDTITFTSAVEDIIEGSNKIKKAVFLVIRTNYTNQNGEGVAKARTTAVYQ